MMIEGSRNCWSSVAGIAAYLGGRSTTICKWITRKSMPAHKAGWLWRFKVEEVDEWMRSGKAAQGEQD